MDCIKITFFLLLSVTYAKAQTFSEWFDQKNTQKKYLLQQIAALQAYASVLKTGYRIAHAGLGSIGSSAKTEYNLHNRYYTGLKTASPAVKNSSQVRDILRLQGDINTALSRLPQDPYDQRVKAAVLKDCSQQLTELQQVASDNNLEMSNNERLKRINAIHFAMLGSYCFAIRFCNQAALIEHDKINQPKDIQTLRNLYGTH
jgi:hypothetical protein